jgi:hypothetical protein
LITNIFFVAIYCFTLAQDLRSDSHRVELPTNPHAHASASADGGPAGTKGNTMTTGLATVDTASGARIALVGIGVGGTLTLSRLAKQADKSWSGTVLDIVDRPECQGT